VFIGYTVPRALFPRDGVEAVRNFLSAFFLSPLVEPGLCLCAPEEAGVFGVYSSSTVHTIHSLIQSLVIFGAGKPSFF
jgi:hypothetical protein